MVWAAIGAAAITVVGGAINAHNAKKNGEGGNPGAAAAADPFASQRPQYQAQLQNLMANPSSVQNDPGYKFNMQQGLDAVTASKASQGIGTSGAADAARMTFAEGLASSTYQQDFNNLSMLSGANSGNPGAASQAITAGNNNVNAGIGSLAGLAGKGIDAWNRKPATPDGTPAPTQPNPNPDQPAPAPAADPSAPSSFAPVNPWEGSAPAFTGTGGY